MPDKATSILLVCANPRGTDPLRTGEEDRTLRESIQLSPNRDHIEVETLNAATVDDLRRALLRKPFDVVHFSGHGTQIGLVFEDANGKLMVPPSSALSDLLARRHVKVALLNACYSLSVGKITAIGLEYTIASTGPISDPGAIEFTRGFYDALGAGTNVPDAYEEGLSAAELKGFHLDTILLKHGEEYVPTRIPQPQLTTVPRVPSDAPRTLLGIAIDTSGSMQTSIRNPTGESLSRFSSVKAALTEVGAQVRDEVLRRSTTAPDVFRAFVYAFGLRIGTGIADMTSLWKAAKNIDLEKEIELRKKRYQDEGRRKAAGYGDLASLARSYGFGELVDSMADAAKSTVRGQVIGEIANMVLAEANRLGDSTLTAEDLASLFGSAPVSFDERVVKHIIFGLTPMTSAATEIRDRFGRMGDGNYDQRVLLVVSDGEPTDGDPRPSFTAMREAGVNIMACFVTDADIADPRLLLGAPLTSWPDGPRLMWDIASPLDESSLAARYLLTQGWSIEPNAKLFVQVNHSEVLKEFVRVVASYFTTEATSLLPRGQ